MGACCRERGARSPASAAAAAPGERALCGAAPAAASLPSRTGAARVGAPAQMASFTPRRTAGAVDRSSIAAKFLWQGRRRSPPIVRAVLAARAGLGGSCPAPRARGAALWAVMGGLAAWDALAAPHARAARGLGAWGWKNAV